MKISAIVAVYNGAKRIREAIASIHEQELKPFELIVVDDGSTDETPAILGSYGDAIRVLNQRHAGVSAAHNHAVRESRGDAIAFLDHDDLWMPHSMRALAELMQADPLVDIASGKVDMRYERKEPMSDDMRRRLVEVNRPFMMHSLLIRRPVFDRIGGFDEKMTYAQDVDWYMRARDAGCKFAFTPEITMIYRMHESNMTRDEQGTAQAIVAALKHGIDRRRKV
jgi:glycosyltransferase involved in cell wall biosynthesis